MSSNVDSRSSNMAGEVVRQLKRRGQELGFALVGISDASQPDSIRHLDTWLAAGMHGTMEYMSRRRDACHDLKRVLQGAQSIILVAENYRQPPTPENALSSAGRIAAYAQGASDYHLVLKKKLRQLAEILHQNFPESRSRAIVDTAPVLERDLARRAGLGWFGKNTMLIHRRVGSFFFLGALLTDVALPIDAPHATDHCGTCTRCLDICPTQAFPQPHVLDARRCISYLTIELRESHIPEDLREGIGNWLFGCDLCQDVCPWNHKAPTASEAHWQRRADLPELTAEQLLFMSDEEFTSRFANTPLARTGRIALARNAAIVLGNSGDPHVLPVLYRAVQHHSNPLVLEACTWAIQRLQQTSSQGE